VKTPAPITKLLASAGRGDDLARDQLFGIVYDELRAIARNQMASEGSGRTMQPTALVHEAYLRLFGGNPVDWSNRCHFFAVAAKMMRRIRIDDARTRKRLKRGGGRRRISLDEGDGVSVADEWAAVYDDDPAAQLALDEALQRLEQIDPLVAEVVVLRYYGGMNRDEISAAIGIGSRTVDKHWDFARTWLFGALGGG
jgi:RNA polymerase sigma factor (TIGR02999 family)